MEVWKARDDSGWLVDIGSECWWLVGRAETWHGNTWMDSTLTGADLSRHAWFRIYPEEEGEPR